MNNLTKEKKQQLALVVILTLVLASAFWGLFIRAQQQEQEASQKKQADLTKKISDAKVKLGTEQQIADRLAAAEQKIARREATMVDVSDAYSWVLSQFGGKTVANNLNFTPDKGHADEAGIFPKFPYPAWGYQAVKASGYYKDFGKFLADIETDYPFLRIQNLTMEPAGYTPTDENLLIRFDIVSLSNTNKIK